MKQYSISRPHFEIKKQAVKFESRTRAHRTQTVAWLNHNPMIWADQHRNLTSSCQSHTHTPPKISPKLVNYFLSYLVFRLSGKDANR